jgi:hypothetical protein
VLANNSSGSWARAAIDTNKRIITEEIEIDFTAPALLGFDRCLDGSVLSSALSVCIVSKSHQKLSIPKGCHEPELVSRSRSQSLRSFAKGLNLKGVDDDGHR